jgi:uncharacterized protein YdeI (YjbR/CyaY-like superfamily)
MKTLHVTTREDWRAWLAAHHDTEREIWLVYAKQHTGQPRVPYEDAVEEALCYGWIDSIVKRLDEDFYAQKFTPRKATSNWSESNLRRYAKLLKAGRLAPPGLAKGPPAEGKKKPIALAAEEEGALPEYIQQRLQRNAQAWRNFQNLAPSYRRLYVKWIESAKREETRLKRLEEAATLLEQNRKLGLK